MRKNSGHLVDAPEVIVQLQQALLMRFSGAGVEEGGAVVSYSARAFEAPASGDSTDAVRDRRTDEVEPARISPNPAVRCRLGLPAVGFLQEAPEDVL